MKYHLYFQRTADGALQVCDNGSAFEAVDKARALELVGKMFDDAPAPAAPVGADDNDADDHPDGDDDDGG